MKKDHAQLFYGTLCCLITYLSFLCSGCDGGNNNNNNNNGPATTGPATTASVTPTPLTPADMDSIKMKPQTGMGAVFCLKHFMIREGETTVPDFCDFTVSMANGTPCDFLRNADHVCVACDDNKVCDKSTRTYTLEFYKNGSILCAYTIQRATSNCTSCGGASSRRFRIVPCP